MKTHLTAFSLATAAALSAWPAGAAPATSPVKTKPTQAAAAQVAATATTAATAASANQLLPAQSEVRFTAKQMGVSMPGMFSKLAGSVQWNAAKPEASRIRLEIPVASATVGAPEMDAELPKAEWFGASQFPTAVFESSSVHALGGNRYEVQGSLNIKGVRLPVKTEATVLPNPADKGATSTASGTLNIARLAYKIGLGAWGDTSVVADAVQIQYNIRLKTQP
ncbi:MAG: YceI family protein [Brachymonas sp.]|jgi:polyisoprenoid-binding protein YceI